MIRLDKSPKSELLGKLCSSKMGGMVNTGELNTNDNQEINHKAHLR